MISCHPKPHHLRWGGNLPELWVCFLHVPVSKRTRPRVVLWKQIIKKTVCGKTKRKIECPFPGNFSRKKLETRTQDEEKLQNKIQYWILPSFCEATKKNPIENTSVDCFWELLLLLRGPRVCVCEWFSGDFPSPRAWKRNFPRRWSTSSWNIIVERLLSDNQYLLVYHMNDDETDRGECDGPWWWWWWW